MKMRGLPLVIFIKFLAKFLQNAKPCDFISISSNFLRKCQANQFHQILNFSLFYTRLQDQFQPIFNKITPLDVIIKFKPILANRHGLPSSNCSPFWKKIQGVALVIFVRFLTNMQGKKKTCEFINESNHISDMFTAHKKVNQAPNFSQFKKKNARITRCEFIKSQPSCNENARLTLIFKSNFQPIFYTMPWYYQICKRKCKAYPL